MALSRFYQALAKFDEILIIPPSYVIQQCCSLLLGWLAILKIVGGIRFDKDVNDNLNAVESG